MKLPVFIARRYLFSKKKQNAINIISAISVAGVAVGTTALIVVLSVFNGIDSLLTEATDSFTADILVTPAEGKFMAADTALLERLAGEEAVASADVAVEEKSLVKFGDNLVPVTVKGVGPDYDAHNHISASIAGGRFALTVDSLPAAPGLKSLHVADRTEGCEMWIVDDLRLPLVWRMKDNPLEINWTVQTME